MKLLFFTVQRLLSLMQDALYFVLNLKKSIQPANAVTESSMQIGNGWARGGFGNCALNVTKVTQKIWAIQEIAAGRK